FGEPITLTAIVDVVAPGAGTTTGTVAFVDGGTTLGTATVSGNSPVTITTSSLSVGSHNISAVYSGDGSFAGSTSATQAVTVGQASTTTALSASNSTPVFGELITLTASVTVAAPGAGTPSGTVTFVEGATTLGTGTVSGGSVTITTSSLS